MLFIYIKNLFLEKYRTFQSSKSVVRIQKNWGKVKLGSRNYNLISIYHKLKIIKSDFELVDEGTWSDLNFLSLFEKIDRCISSIGGQYLYHIMHVYENSKEILKQRCVLYDYFLKNNKVREKIISILHKLNNSNASFIPNLLFKDLPRRPKLFFIVYILPVLFIISGVLIIFKSYFIILFLLLGITNITLHIIFQNKLSEYCIDMSHLSTLLWIAVKLADIEDRKIPQLNTLRKNRAFAKHLRKKIGWLAIEKSSLDNMTSMAVDYFNYFFLFNLISYFRSIEHIRKNQKELIEIYEAVASIDALISVSSYLSSISYYSYPVNRQDKKLKFDNVYHPLIKNAISNSYNSDSYSCLITGSNMAGKTTFIKTVGINIILSRTLGICLAKKAELGDLIIRTSIKRGDDINSNKSYYYKEIEAIQEFIKLSNNDGKNYIFLIDEIFRGTNTLERISASAAVLEYLSKNSMVIVTTHDIELQSLLKSSFNVFHFSEQIDNNNHYFDYKLKSGICKNRNAIKLLQIKGYPEEITDKAKEITETIK